MPSPDQEQILFAVLGVQFGFVKPEQLARVTRAWLADPAVGLADRLVEEGLITAGQRRMIEGLKTEAQQLGGGDAADTLLSLGGGKAVTRAFGGEVDLPVETVPFDVGGQVDDFSTDTGPFFGEHPGRYTILGEHGRGGQARVYRAFDAQVGREVAMKELRPDPEEGREPSTPGSFTTPASVRFVREARITGELEHPNIVPVHEIGFRANGRPYYTMQLVRGETLSRKLSRGRTLDERLKLLGPFWDLCNAIAFAHTRGVIHRDIKPSNVMVGEFGETLVLDWGVAKVKGSTDLRAREMEQNIRQIRGDQSLETVMGSTIGTPSYMSPEQAQGEIDRIDERSDVWGLGAVLYEILTGGPPFDGHQAFEVITKVVDEPVPPVTQFCPEAPADLVAVAEKALRQDPAQRYQSAREMAEDVSAYMTGGRVRAYSYSSWQLFRRFAGRYKLVLSSIAVALVLLIGLSIGAYFRVRAERDRAKTQRNEAMKFANLLVDDLFEKIKPLVGSTGALDTLVTSTLGYFDQHVDPRAGPPEERFALAVTYRKVGDVAMALGKTAQAREAKEQSRRIVEQLLAGQPDNPEYQKEHVYSLEGLMEVANRENRVSESEALGRQGLEEATRLLKRHPDDPDIQFQVMDFRQVLGKIEASRNKVPQARAHLWAALDLQKQAILSRPDDIGLLDRMAKVYNRLSRVSFHQGNHREAFQLARKSLDIARRMVSIDPRSKKSQRMLFIAYYSYASKARFVGDQATFLEYTGMALAQAQRLAEADPANHDAKRDLLAATEASARALAYEGKYDQAIRQYQQTLETARKLAEHDPASMKAAGGLYFCLVNFSSLAIDLERKDLAHGHFQQAMSLVERFLAADPDDEWARGEKVWLLYRLAVTHPDGPYSQQARKSCRSYLDQATALTRQNAAWERNTRSGRAYCQAIRGNLDGFHAVILKAQQKNPQRYSQNFDLVEAHLLTGRYAQAIELGTRLLGHQDCQGRRIATLHLYLGIARLLAGYRKPAADSLARSLAQVEKDVDHGSPYLEMFAAEAVLSRLKSPHRKPILTLLRALNRWTNLGDPEPLKRQLRVMIRSLR